ncbi:hypothetical protein NYQ10_10190 [Flavobacterium johnsoniae]|uniref:hypothetical protein n=1 Tax=Flavobacterium johnsoniae TaxID=986 RepID=UPI0025B07B61|nr:hypothetical protein [Flavobacterium johnsoniae]WJS96804.1 hypothetical protein NYQ10_10190 [Flavobacterium johnsoniae]
MSNKQDSKDVKEVTLYNFSTIRNAEYLTKEKLNDSQNFICYDKSLFDLEMPISDKTNFDKKIFLNFEKLKAKRKKDEIKGIACSDEVIQISLNDVFERIMYLYNSKSDNFYEINNLLLGLNENKDVKIDFKSVNLSVLQKKVWLSFIYNLKFGNDFKQKEIATNLLRFFHLKKYRNLIDDESKDEKLENFDSLINAQIVIPEELFPKSETFFYGDKYRLKDYYLELLTNNHAINAIELNKGKSNIEDIIKKLKKEEKILKDNINNEYEFEKKESANSCYASSMEFINQEYYFLLSTDILNDSNFQDEIKMAKLKIKLKVETAEIEEDPITKVKKNTKDIKTVYRNFEFNSSSKNSQFSRFAAYFKIIPTQNETILLEEPKDDLNQTIHFNIEIEFESGREETISNKLIWKGKYFFYFEAKGYFSEEDSYGTAYKPKGYGIQMLGIADYRKVVSTISRYIPAEVAHIENVMASEFREKVTTKETTTENKEFESTDTEIENLKETTANDRFQMQTEVAQILNEQRKNDVNTNSTVNGTGYSFNLTTGNSTSGSKEDSNKQAVTTAKEVTNKAVEKIVSKVKKERTVTVTEKFIDVNKYGFDNRGSKDHVSGIYRHINAVYRNRIQNYGKRLTYEFSIPEPALVHKLGRIVNDYDLLEKINNIKPEKPTNPKDFFKDFNEITIDNYIAFKNLFGIKELKDYPSCDPFTLSRESSKGEGDFEIPLIKGFIPTTFHLFSIVDAGSPDIEFKTEEGGGQYFEIDLNDKNIYYTAYRTGHILGDDKNKINNSGNILISYPIPSLVKCAIRATKIEFYRFNFTLNFIPDIKTILEWKKEFYDTIIKEYEKKLKIYNEAVEDIIKEYEKQKIKSDEDKNRREKRNYRQIEIQSLKRNCLSYLIDEENRENTIRDFGTNLYKKRTDFTDTLINKSHKLDEYTAFVRFLEQAFEWNEMSYSFYPYYWGKKEIWKENYNEDSEDPLHKAFLQAGMARVIVTVRPGFNDAVNMYLTTGKIWQGGNLPVYGSSMFVSIAEELRENTDYTVQDEWESVLPTNLIVLQSSGVSIEQKGLPDLFQNGNLGGLENHDKKLKRKKLFGLF